MPLMHHLDRQAMGALRRGGTRADPNATPRLGTQLGSEGIDAGADLFAVAGHGGAVDVGATRPSTNVIGTGATDFLVERKRTRTYPDSNSSSMWADLTVEGPSVADGYCLALACAQGGQAPRTEGFRCRTTATRARS